MIVTIMRLHQTFNYFSSDENLASIFVVQNRFNRVLFVLLGLKDCVSKVPSLGVSAADAQGGNLSGLYRPQSNRGTTSVLEISKKQNYHFLP
jgi:hypothetical protein